MILIFMRCLNLLDKWQKRYIYYITTTKTVMVTLKMTTVTATLTLTFGINIFFVFLALKKSIKNRILKTFIFHIIKNLLKYAIFDVYSILIQKSIYNNLSSEMSNPSIFILRGISQMKSVISFVIFNLFNMICQCIGFSISYWTFLLLENSKQTVLYFASNHFRRQSLTNFHSEHGENGIFFLCIDQLLLHNL